MSSLPWTPRQVARLRALAGLYPLKEVARLMRRSYSSVKNAICKLDIDCGRAWTPGQLARLRADYGKLPARQLAQALGRPLPAVYRMARKLGLSRTASRFTEEDLARIRELNGQGWSDTEIARALGRDRHETTKHRKRLHLPSQQHGQRVRARLAAALQRQLERQGLHSAAELRKHAHQAHQAYAHQLAALAQPVRPLTPELFHGGGLEQAWKCGSYHAIATVCVSPLGVLSWAVMLRHAEGCDAT
jgi:hypothetical protein